MVVIFYLLSFLSIFFSFLIMISNNPIYSLLYLILLIFSISGIFFTLGSIFLGTIEIIIYAGAIMVLFIFVVMLIKNNIRNSTILLNQSNNFYDMFSYTCTFFILFILFIQFISEKKKILFFKIFLIKDTGILLFSKYIFLIEFISLLLLSSVFLVYFFIKKINFIFNS
ncbi:NADH-quinone oxidoreductase subunit J family protein [Buchnera aphidicola]|uniref:NADH-quinone oxidoreductase subunit J n=1 Tax=Buchnera aphidicola (Cinara curvipes) TaxID=2518975 RepID=A0A451D6I2_9GAMM|nr:NADH-quinone oxidoreductase subunit J [Buchnera aphidicola]VFP81406.1 NADH-quinone oxidoreductase subunit J [Buchnera aphidicola (Cinara curvipes)]